MHIAVAGNIGSGKTTLTKLLAKHYGYKPVYESGDNPYMDSYYEDMRRWAFNMHVYFLGVRFKQLVDVMKENPNIVQDRTLYEDAYIFAPNLNAMGLMNTRDYENYHQLFELLSSFVQPPDLIVYLRADVSSIRLDYLTSLNQRYEDWIANYDKGKMIIVDVEQTNFADSPEDLGHVINQIDAEFNSLFN